MGILGLIGDRCGRDVALARPQPRRPTSTAAATTLWSAATTVHEIVGYNVTEYDEANLVEAPFSPTSTNGGAGFKTVEGRITLIYYTLPQGRSTLEVLRNYEQSLKAKGFAESSPAPPRTAPASNSASPKAATCSARPSAIRCACRSSPTTMSRTGSRAGRPLPACPARSPGGRRLRRPLSRRKQRRQRRRRPCRRDQGDGDRQDPVHHRKGDGVRHFATPARLPSTGSCSTSTRTSSSRSPSRPSTRSRCCLKSNPELKLRIVGHTDNQGSADYNLDLSQRRAASVVAALVSAYGIAAGRLTAGWRRHDRACRLQRHRRRAGAEPARRASAEQSRTRPAYPISGTALATG